MRTRGIWLAVAAGLISGAAGAQPAPEARYNIAGERLVILMPAPRWQDCGVTGPTFGHVFAVETTVLGRREALPVEQLTLLLDFELGTWRVSLANVPAGLPERARFKITYTQPMIMPSDGEPGCAGSLYTVEVEADRDSSLAATPHEQRADGKDRPRTS